MGLGLQWRQASPAVAIAPVRHVMFSSKNNESRQVPKFAASRKRHTDVIFDTKNVSLKNTASAIRFDRAMRRDNAAAYVAT